MSVSRDNRGFFLSRFTILLLGIAILHSLAAALSQTQSAETNSTPAQAQIADGQTAQAAHKRFWLAGRYDGNRIIIYFDAVKSTAPSRRLRKD
jgi:hypothetical protein